MNDYGLNFIRPRLVTIEGSSQEEYEQLAAVPELVASR